MNNIEAIVRQLGHPDRKRSVGGKIEFNWRVKIKSSKTTGKPTEGSVYYTTDFEKPIVEIKEDDDDFSVYYIEIKDIMKHLRK